MWASVGAVVAGAHLYAHPGRFSGWGDRVWRVVVASALAAVAGGAGVRSVAQSSASLHLSGLAFLGCGVGALAVLAVAHLMTTQHTPRRR